MNEIQIQERLALSFIKGISSLLIFFHSPCSSVDRVPASEAGCAGSIPARGAKLTGVYPLSYN